MNEELIIALVRATNTTSPYPHPPYGHLLPEGEGTPLATLPAYALRCVFQQNAFRRQLVADGV